MSTAVPEDIAETSGPNASLPFGDATRMADLQRQTGQLATGPASPAGPPPGMPAMPQAPAAPAPPVQPPSTGPAPGAPNPPGLDFDPSNPATAFGPTPAAGPINSWREEWQQQAMHPAAGPMIKAMAAKATQSPSAAPVPPQNPAAPPT